MDRSQVQTCSTPHSLAGICCHDPEGWAVDEEVEETETTDEDMEDMIDSAVARLWALLLLLSASLERIELRS